MRTGISMYTTADDVDRILELTHELGGANYVLWGGREGYSSLLNTDMKRELDQLGRPTMFYGDSIHDRCYRRPFYDQGKFAKNLEAAKTYLILLPKECGACLEH